MLSARAKNLKSSPTLALVAKAKELMQLGHDVISLTVGEPDWPTYKVAAEEGISAIQRGATKYTAAQGTIELRKAISLRFEKDLGLQYNPASEVTVTSGAKFAIFSALQVLCDKNDEVVIPSPYWVSYPAMVELADARPVIVYCDESVHFKLTPEQLAQKINEKTKVFLFCSPSNPTGFVYSEDELKKIAEVLRKFPRVVIISDDMYNRLMFEGEKIAPHLLQAAPDLKDRTVLINGGSKAYSMTGWRIGWAAGPTQIIKAMGDYVSQATGSASSIAQAAAEKALIYSEADIINTNHMLKQRLESALNKLKELPQLKVYKPDGAFYLWVNVSSLLGLTYEGTKVLTSAEFCKILLEKFFVSTVPGEEFGHPGYMRLSFAIETPRMNEAFDRMKQLISQMK